MRKRWVLGLICLLLCLLPACGQEKPAANDVPPASESPVEAAPQKREADFSAAFGGIQGCAVLYDPGTDQWTFYQEEMCRQRVSPALPSRLSPPSWAFTQGFCPDRRAP